MTKSKKSDFRPNDFVVYPAHGVGKIMAPGAAPLWRITVGSTMPRTAVSEDSSGKIIWPCI